MKKIFDIIKSPFIVPARLNRVKFINKLMLNIALLILVCTLPVAILTLYLDYLGISFSASDIKSLATSSPAFLSYFYKAYSALLTLYIILFIITFWRLHIARFHDINFRGIWSLLLIIPVISSLIRLILFTVPGTKSTNKFADQPASESKFKTLLAVVNAIIIIILFLGIVIALSTS